MNSTHIQIHSELSELRKLRKLTEDFYKPILEEAELDRVILAIEEAVSNVILHGYKHYKEGTIEVVLSYTENELTIQIQDQAPFFDGNQINLNMTEISRSPYSGLGIYLMKKLMDIEYIPQEGGGTLLIMKKLNYSKKKK